MSCLYAQWRCDVKVATLLAQTIVANQASPMTAVPSSQALYPRTVTPPAEPLSLFRFVLRFIENPLLALPQQAYEDWLVAQESANRVIYWVSAPALIEDLLLRNADKLIQSPVQKRVLRRALRDGVLSADGELWRWQRRTMAPVFRPAEILTYVPVMAAPAEETLERWRASAPGSLQHIDEAMTEATFAVIMRTMLKGGITREAEIIRRETSRGLKNITWDMLYGSFRLPEWLPHPASWTLERSARRMRRAVRDIIERRVREADGENANDLLARLLAARDPETGEPMSMERLINNLLTLLEAGHETTSRALSWTLYLLARATEWQDAVRKEVRSVIGDQPIEGRHIEQLTVTQQVLKESMRLYPPVPVMSRVATEAFKAGGADFPEGCIILFPIYCIHRHRQLWDDPARFDPSRFAPERGDYPRTQYMPFGAGSRICLGASFAMAEATAILATLIRGASFEWDGIVDPEPVSRVTLQAKGGIALKVTPLQ
jgi:cytochrome P450